MAPYTVTYNNSSHKTSKYQEMRIHADLYGPTDSVCISKQERGIDPKLSLRRHIHGSKPFVKKIHTRRRICQLALPRVRT